MLNPSIGTACGVRTPYTYTCTHAQSDATYVQHIYQVLRQCLVCVYTLRILGVREACDTVLLQWAAGDAVLHENRHLAVSTCRLLRQNLALRTDYSGMHMPYTSPGMAVHAHYYAAHNVAPAWQGMQTENT